MEELAAIHWSWLQISAVRSPSAFLFRESYQPLEHAGSGHCISEDSKWIQVRAEEWKKIGLFLHWSLLGLNLLMVTSTWPVSYSYM